MECFWRLCSYRQPDGHCNGQNPAIFYVCLHPNNGLSYHYLYGTCILEKYASVHMGGEEESLVLFVNKKAPVCKYKHFSGIRIFKSDSNSAVTNTHLKPGFLPFLHQSKNKSAKVLTNKITMASF